MWTSGSYASRNPDNSWIAWSLYDTVTLRLFKYAISLKRCIHSLLLFCPLPFVARELFLQVDYIEKRLGLIILSFYISDAVVLGMIFLGIKSLTHVPNKLLSLRSLSAFLWSVSASDPFSSFPDFVKNLQSSLRTENKPYISNRPVVLFFHIQKNYLYHQISLEFVL